MVSIEKSIQKTVSFTLHTSVLKRAKDEKEAIYILEQALDIYSRDHLFQTNFRYIRSDEMK